MTWTQYVPSGVLLVGATLTFAWGAPKPTQLDRPLNETINAEFLGVSGRDVPIDTIEQRISGVTSYLNRAFDVGSPAGPMLFYVGYHATQQGKNGIHLPTVCLPGAGWTPTSSSLVALPIEGKVHHLNRYILQKGTHQILVYYWFQGRGHVTAGELDLKRHSIRDALLHRRDEEALVRIVVPIVENRLETPIGNTQLPADSLSIQFALMVIPELHRALPAMPR